MNTHPILPYWATNAVLYEVNVRQFSQEGTLKAVVPALPRLQQLGVDVLWLMPIFPIGKKNRKGSLGSPYSVQDYLNVNPDFGTSDDLRSLVAQAHSMHMRVILDWVPNHTAWDHVWVSAHPEYYTKINGEFTAPLNEHGEPIYDWSDACDLNYGNPALRVAMIDAMLLWVRLFDIDGFRIDMSGLVPLDFWREAYPLLQAVKPLFMLSEWQDEREHFNTCFHVNYGWRFKDVTKAIAAGEANALALDALLQELNDYYPAHYEQLYFTLNHDENSWSGTEQELYGDFADAINILVFTWQGIPMLYNGQEASMEQRLAFFDRDPIRWSQPDRAVFFQKLIELRHLQPALATGHSDNKPIRLHTTDDAAVYAFYRKKGTNTVIVLLNMTKEQVQTSIHLPPEIGGEYLNHFTQSPRYLASSFEVLLEPCGYLIFIPSIYI